MTAPCSLAPWSLVGGPLCGETAVIVGQSGWPVYEIASSPLSRSLMARAPITDSPSVTRVTGIYRAGNRGDVDSRVLRWQGWA
jgi:hypothetical protein